VLMLEFLDFQVNVCPGQAGRIKAIEVTGRMTGNSSLIGLWKSSRQSAQSSPDCKPSVIRRVLIELPATNSDKPQRPLKVR
jgi:hypothetical protein